MYVKEKGESILVRGYVLGEEVRKLHSVVTSFCIVSLVCIRVGERRGQCQRWSMLETSYIEEAHRIL